MAQLANSRNGKTKAGKQRVSNTVLSSEIIEACLLCSSPVEESDKTRGRELNSAWKKRIINLCNQLGCNKDELPDQFSKEKFPFCNGCKLDLKVMWNCQQQLQTTERQIQKKVLESQSFYSGLPATKTPKFLKLRNMILGDKGQEENLTVTHFQLSGVAASLQYESRKRSCTPSTSTPKSSFVLNRSQTSNLLENSPSQSVISLKIVNCVGANGETVPNDNGRGLNIPTDSSTARPSTSFNHSQRTSSLTTKIQPIFVSSCQPNATKIHAQAHNESDLSELSSLAPTQRKVINPNPTSQPPPGTKQAQRGDCEYQCDVCDKSFQNKYSFLQHQRTHSVVKENPKEGSKRTTTAVKKRMNSSNKIEKLIRCPESECGKMFAQKNHLASHIRAHERKAAPKPQKPKPRHWDTLSMFSIAPSSLISHKLRSKKIFRKHLEMARR